MLGGVGNNPGFVESMRRELEQDQIYLPDEPEFGAAVGAAIVASEAE
jgi:benzoyl-CoA reductase subunit D